jgi:hypothetical protein
MFKFQPFLALAVACVACGASFSASDGSGGSGGTGKAGEASGGLGSSAGSPSAGDAGAMDVGGTSSAGQSSTAGTAGAAAGRGGTGSGGRGAGGAASGSGGAAGADCTKLAQQYQAAVEKARVCDKGSTDQCSPSSVAQPVGGCGCPVLINAKSEYAATAKKAYQAYQDGKCDFGGAICDIACPSATSASCAQQAMASGNYAYVCAAQIAIQN